MESKQADLREVENRMVIGRCWVILGEGGDVAQRLGVLGGMSSGYLNVQCGGCGHQYCTVS